MTAPPAKERRPRTNIGIHGRFVLLILVVFLPLLLLVGLDRYDRYEKRKDQELATNLGMARTLAGRLEEFVRDVLRHEAAIASAVGSGELSPASVALLLRSSLESHSMLYDIFLLDMSGRIVQTGNPAVKDLDLSRSTLFLKLQDGTEWWASDLFYDPISQKMLFNVARGVHDPSGAFVGVISFLLDADRLGPLFDAVGPTGGVAAAYDHSGKLVFSNPAQTLAWEDRDVLDHRPEIVAALKGREVFASRPEHGEEREGIVAVVPVSSMGWAVEVVRPREDVLGAAREGLVESVALGACVITASLLAAFLVARSVVRPLRLLREGIASRGRDGADGRLDTRGLREISELAEAFNVMSEEIQQRERHLREERRFMARTLDSIPLLVTRLDRDLVFRQCNRAGVEVLGRPPEEVVGRGLGEVLPPEAYPALWKHIRVALETGETGPAVPLPFEKPHKPGEECFLLVSFLPERDEEGVVTGVFFEGLDVTETERLHREVDSHRDLLQTVSDNTPAGVALIDAETFRLKFCNNCCKSFIDPEHRDVDPLGLRIEDLVPGVAETRLNEILETVARTGKPYANPESEFANPERGITYWKWSASPVPDERGDVKELLLVALDVTDQVVARKAVEEVAREAREARNILHALMEHAPEGITIADGPDATIRMMSRYGLELGGRLPETILGSSDGVHSRNIGIHRADGITPADDAETPLIRAIRFGEVVTNEEWALKRPDGSVVTILCNAGPIRDSDGRISGGVVAWRDISERKDAEERLKRREAEYRALIDNAPDPIVRYDRDLRRIYMNSAARSAFGLAPDGWEGTNAGDGVLTAQSRVRCREALNRVFRTGVTETVELVLGTGTGERYHQVHIAPEVSRSDQIETVIAIGRDISSFKVLEKDLRFARDSLEIRVRDRTLDLGRANVALQERARELSNRNRELEDMTFIASHDLQEPLRKIQTFASRLKSRHAEALGADGIDALDRVEQSASRMRDLIQDVLEYSRVVSRGRPFTRIDLDELMDRLIQGFEGPLRETGGSIDLQALCVVSGDPQQIHRLFHAIIDNALKFRREGVSPIVRVGCRVRSPGVTMAGEGPPPAGIAEIRIEDNGIGFDEKYLARIFTPMEQLHGHGVYAGTGMGLAIGRRIVERHGGAISATSRPGEGSAFIVVLPLHHVEGPAMDECLLLDPGV